MSRRSRPASCRFPAAIRASSGSSCSWRSARTISWARANRSTPRSNWSLYSKSIEAGFVDPYFLDKSILLGANLFRRDYRSFNLSGTTATRPIRRSAPAAALRLGFPITEYWSFGARYTLEQDKVSLDQATFYTDPDGRPLPATCDPLKAGRYLCDEIGRRLTSLVGFSTIYDDTDGIHPTRGQRLTWSEDFAGLGGDVRYIRSQPGRDEIPQHWRRLDRVAPRRRRLHRAAAESRRIRTPTRFGSPTASSIRASAASTFAAWVRASCVSRITLDGTLQPPRHQQGHLRRARRPGLLFRTAGARVPGQLGPQERGLEAVRLHRHRIAVERQEAAAARHREHSAVRLDTD